VSAPAAPARRPAPLPTPELSVPRRVAPSGIAVGDRVFHEKFGYGSVRGIEAGKLEVEFPTGRKKVMDSFVRKA
jgi:hypothetical protein